MLLRVLVVSFALLVSTVAHATRESSLDESCTESLTLKPLAPSGSLVLAYFQFECAKVLQRDSAGRLETPRHFTVFPRLLGQLVASTGVDRFRLSLARGQWDPRWGEPDVNGTSVSAANGAELVASFRPLSDGSVSDDSTWLDTAWLQLANGLAGLLCASLNFVTKPAAFSSPVLAGVSVEPAAAAAGRPFRAAVKGLLRHGALGRETVCTENLTPWTKLLPCGTHAGLAARISAAEVFGGRHHSLTVEVDSEDISGGNTTVRVRQTLSAVLDAPQEGWSLQSLLRTGDSAPCPAMTGPMGVELLWPKGASLQEGNVQGEGGSDLMLTAAGMRHLPEAFKALGEDTRAPIQATRFMLDEDGLRGALVTRIENRANRDWSVLTHEAVPWWLRVHFHTLEVTVDEQSVLDSSAVWHAHFTPAEDRSAMAQVELGVTLPAKSTVVISITFIKAFMRQADFPADVSRGLDLPAVAVTYQDLAGELTPVRIYTESVLVPMPFPDFSMPFNVITYVCTLVALFFGSIVNVVALRQPPKEKKGAKPGLMARLQAKVKGAFARRPATHEKAD